MKINDSIDSCFSTSYGKARQKFLAQCAQTTATLRVYESPRLGLDGEKLAVDCALFGKPGAAKLLIVSSGCHGVEGFCGSGIQTHSLSTAFLQQLTQQSAVSVLYLHALNPHGFSYGRRVTEENVDLNRNFHDFSKPLPANEGYREVHPLLLPALWPPTADNQTAIAALMQSRGYAAVQSAVASGQYEFPDGLFFGGTQPTWSNTTLRQILRDYAQKATDIGWIDIHTGLGPAGHGERIFAPCIDPESEFARAYAWWGGEGKTPVTRSELGESASTVLRGTTNSMVQFECPHARVAKIVLEFGTEPPISVLMALRGDHWLHNHPDAPPLLSAAIRQATRDAFFVDTSEWKKQVVDQAQQAIRQGLVGLAHI